MNLQSDVRPTWSIPKKIAVLCVSLLVVAIVAAGGFAGYKYLKLWRAHYLARAGTELAKKPETSNEGVSELLSAYHLEPLDLEVVRTMARYDMTIHNPLALSFYGELLSLPGVTRDDRREAAKAFASFGELAKAESLVKALLTEQPEASDYALQGELNWAAQSPQKALENLQTAIQLAPSDRQIQLIYAQFQAIAGTPDERIAGRQQLRSLGEAKDGEGLQALVTLANIPHVDVPTLNWVQQSLQAHPLLDDSGRFALWSIQKQLGTVSENEIMKGVLESFKDADLPRKAAAARWLYSQGHAELSLELATPSESLKNPDLFLARLDSLAFLGRWEQVRQELAPENIPMKEPMAWLYRARAASELKNPGESESDWERARTAAASDPGMLNYLGDYASKLNLYKQAILSYRALTHVPRNAELAYHKLLAVEARGGTDDDLLDTLSQMIKDFPNEPEPRNDWAYLSLLLKQNIDRAVYTAQGLVSASPQYLTYRTTLALGLLRLNQPKDAATLYTNLQINWDQTPDNARMVYAAVLEANGLHDNAVKFAKSIDKSHLRSAELAYLASVFPSI